MCPFTNTNLGAGLLGLNSNTAQAWHAELNTAKADYQTLLQRSIPQMHTRFQLAFKHCRTGDSSLDGEQASQVAGSCLITSVSITRQATGGQDQPQSRLAQVFESDSP